MLKRFSLLVIIPLFLSACSLPFVGKKPASLQITTTPTSTIFIDGTQVGQTPYFDDQLEAGQHQIKIVPQVTDPNSNLLPFESNTTLVAGTLTAITRDFGTSQADANGYVLSLDLIANQDSASLAVVSTPTGAVVRIDGEAKGFTPLDLASINPGDHQLIISSPGYDELDIKAQTITGHKLNISAQLAKSESDEASATDSAELTNKNTGSDKDIAAKDDKITGQPTAKPTKKITLDKPYVLIGDSPTGFVRVRENATTASKELSRVDPGDAFAYQDEEKVSGYTWYKIEYQDGESGWVRGDLAEKVTE